MYGPGLLPCSYVSALLADKQLTETHVLCKIKHITSTEVKPMAFNGQCYVHTHAKLLAYHALERGLAFHVYALLHTRGDCLQPAKKVAMAGSPDRYLI